MFFTFMQLGTGSHMMRPRIQEKDTEKALFINMEEYWACCGTCVALHNAFTVVIILGLNWYFVYTLHGQNRQTTDRQTQMLPQIWKYNIL